MYGRLIMLDKQPVIHTVVVRETWRRIFAKIMLNVKGPEDTMVCQDDQTCAVIKVGIESAVHRVQDIWDENLTTEGCFFFP